MYVCVCTHTYIHTHRHKYMHDMFPSSRSSKFLKICVYVHAKACMYTYSQLKYSQKSTHTSYDVTEERPHRNHLHWQLGISSSCECSKAFPIFTS